MWSKILLALLLMPMAEAQQAIEPGAPAGQAAPKLEIVVAAHQRYSSLRRGREQEIKIEICRPRDALPGAPFCFNNRTHNEPFVPISLEIAAQPGLAIHYRRGNQYRLLPVGTPVKFDGRSFFLVRLRATGELPLGKHLLQGRLMVLAGDQGPGGAWAGNGTMQELAVKIPVIVVDRETKVAEADEWPTRHTRVKVLRVGGEILGTIAVLGVEWALCGFEFCGGFWPIGR